MKIGDKVKIIDNLAVQEDVYYEKYSRLIGATAAIVEIKLSGMHTLYGIELDDYKPEYKFAPGRITYWDERELSPILLDDGEGCIFNPLQ